MGAGPSKKPDANVKVSKVTMLDAKTSQNQLKDGGDFQQRKPGQQVKKEVQRAAATPLDTEVQVTVEQEAIDRRVIEQQEAILKAANARKEMLEKERIAREEQEAQKRFELEEEKAQMLQRQRQQDELQLRGGSEILSRASSRPTNSNAKTREGQQKLLQQQQEQISRQLQPLPQNSLNEPTANDSALTHVGNSQLGKAYYNAESSTDHSPNIVKIKHAVGVSLEPHQMLSVHTKQDKAFGKKLAQDSSVGSDFDGDHQHHLSPQKPNFEAKIGYVNYQQCTTMIPSATSVSYDISSNFRTNTLQANKKFILGGFANEEQLTKDADQQRNIDMDELQALLGV